MASHIFRSGIVAPAAGKKRRAIKKNFGHGIVAEVDPETAPSYLERMDAQRKEWKEADRSRFYNPDRDPDAEGTWNVYVWGTPNAELQKERWHFMGQKRKKPLRRKPMTINRLCAGIRQSLGIPKERPIKLISEQDDNARKARGDVWEQDPPKHHDTLAPWDAPVEAMKLRSIPKTSRRTLRKDRSPQIQGSPKIASTGRVVGFTFRTRYVAWGKRGAGPWYYLGPCMEQTKAKGKAEIRARFPIYPDPVLIEVRSLSYSMRTRLKEGKLKPGTAKIPLPGGN